MNIFIWTDVAVGRELVGNDLADRQAPIVDRRADPKRSEVVRLERELPPRSSVMTGATSSPVKLSLTRVDVPGLETDVVARQQRAEPGDPAQADASAARSRTSRLPPSARPRAWRSWP